MSLTTDLQKLRKDEATKYDGKEITLTKGTRIQRVSKYFVIDRGRGYTPDTEPRIKDTACAAARFAISRDRRRTK